MRLRKKSCANFGFGGHIAVLVRELDVFGDSKLAMSWLEEPNPALRGLSPLKVALLDDNQEEVMDILGRIEHGVLS